MVPSPGWLPPGQCPSKASCSVRHVFADACGVCRFEIVHAPQHLPGEKIGDTFVEVTELLPELTLAKSAELTADEVARNVHPLLVPHQGHSPGDPDAGQALVRYLTGQAIRPSITPLP